MLTLEQLIFESAITGQEALSDGLGLVTFNINSRNYFILFDKDSLSETPIIKGGIAVDEDSTIPTVVRSATEQGYGPLLYDIALSFYRYLTSDSEVSDEAIKVWDYYYHKRSDVGKTELWRIDDEFEDMKKIEFESVTGKNWEDPNNISLHYAYSLNSKDDSIDSLMAEGNKALKKTKFFKSDFFGIFRKYFASKYK